MATLGAKLAPLSRVQNKASSAFRKRWERNKDGSEADAVVKTPERRQPCFRRRWEQGDEGSAQMPLLKTSVIRLRIFVGRGETYASSSQYQTGERNESEAESSRY